MNLVRACVVACCLGFGWGGSASAAPPGPVPTVKADETKAKPSAREKRLREKVGLDEAKTKKVMALLDAQREARKPARAAIKKAFNALADLVKAGKADDAGYLAATKNVTAARDHLHALEESQLADVMALLTAKEQARYLLTTRKTKKHDKADKAKAAPADAKVKPATKDEDDDDDGPE